MVHSRPVLAWLKLSPESTTPSLLARTTRLGPRPIRNSFHIVSSWIPGYDLRPLSRCRLKKVRFALLAVILATVPVTAKTIRVPANQPTIQAAINAAVNGDIVLVSPGTYTENINFSGKIITVASSNGPTVTLIDGGANGPVVQMVSGETSASILRGFTIRNGYASVNNSSGYGGGIFVQNSSPTISGNTISNNQADGGGNGIAVFYGSPVISNNKIITNSQSPTTFGGIGGGGIAVYGNPSSPQIKGNVVSGNSVSVNGGGIMVESAVSAVLANNSILKNSGGDGGGVWIEDTKSSSVIQNLVAGNSGRFGGGIMVFPLNSNETALLVNNTVAGNSASNGSAVYVFGTDTGVRFYNNLFIGLTGFNAVDCNATGGSVFSFTDAYEPSSGGFGGTCANQSGVNGNISVDPKFVSPASNNYRLKGGSPAIDVGNNSAPSLPGADLAGNSRIINGNGGVTAIVDIGAYEFVPVVLAPKSLSFGLHAVGSTTSKVVKLTNAQNKSLTISSFSAPAGYSVTGCGTSVAAFTSCSLTVTFHPLTSGTFNGALKVNDNAGNSPQTVALNGSAQ